MRFSSILSNIGSAMPPIRAIGKFASKHVCISFWIWFFARRCFGCVPEVFKAAYMCQKLVSMTSFYQQICLTKRLNACWYSSILNVLYIYVLICQDLMNVLISDHVIIWPAACHLPQLPLHSTWALSTHELREYRCRDI